VLRRLNEEQGAGQPGGEMRQGRRDEAQPTTCEVTARTASQPRPPKPAPTWKLPKMRASTAVPNRRSECRLVERAHHADRACRRTLCRWREGIPQDQDEAGVEDRCTDPEDHALRRVGAVGPGADKPSDERHAENIAGSANRSERSGTFSQQRPGQQGDKENLQVAEDCGKAGADGGDGVRPQHEITGKEQPRTAGEPPRPPCHALPRPGRRRSTRRRRPRRGSAKAHRKKAAAVADDPERRTRTADAAMQLAPANTVVVAFRRSVVTMGRPTCHERRRCTLVTRSSGVNLLFTHDTEFSLVTAAALVNTAANGRDSLDDPADARAVSCQPAGIRYVDGHECRASRGRRAAEPTPGLMACARHRGRRLLVNDLLSSTDLKPQLTDHDGRGWHLHAAGKWRTAGTAHEG